MTAEIVVANRIALALAADSAATLEGPAGTKIFNSANKIFQLLHGRPVGAMVYGAATIDGIPWEIVVKSFRDSCTGRSYATLKEVEIDFTNFLDDFLAQHPANENESVVLCVEHVFEILQREFEKLPFYSLPSELNEYQEAFSGILTRVDAGFRKRPPCGLARRILKDKHGKIIDSQTDRFLTTYQLDTKNIKKQLRECIVSFMASNELTDYRSGVVIAGFGDSDIYPGFRSFEIDDSICGLHKKKENGSKAISASSKSFIRAFAQSDVVQNFMSGIHPSMLMFMISNIEKIVSEIPSVFLSFRAGEPLDAISSADKEKITQFNKLSIKKAIDGFLEKLDAKSRQSFSDPIISMVNHFDKDHLATLAESLVNITALRRRVSSDQETVGGPIDVAVISKHDGFIWIKRKHYFNSEINLDFVARRHYTFGVANRSDVRQQKPGGIHER